MTSALNSTSGSLDLAYVQEVCFPLGCRIFVSHRYSNFLYFISTLLIEWAFKAPVLSTRVHNLPFSYLHMWGGKSYFILYYYVFWLNFQEPN